MAKKKPSKPMDAVRSYLSQIGRKGGQVTGPSKARDPEKMRAAINKRWEAHRKKNEDSGEQPPSQGD